VSKTSLTRRAFVQSFLAGASALVAGSAGLRSAHASTTLRIATLLPNGSSPRVALESLASRVKKETAGAVMIQVVSGSSVLAADESGLVRALRSGKLQGVQLSEEGLGGIAAEFWALALPGLFSGNAQVEAARAKLLPKLDSLLQAQKMVLAGFGHAGDRVLAATSPSSTLADLKEHSLFLPLPRHLVLDDVAKEAALPDWEDHYKMLAHLVDTKQVSAALLTPHQIGTTGTTSKFSAVSDFTFGASWHGLVLAESALAGMTNAARATLLSHAKQMSAELTLKLRQEGAQLVAHMLSNGATRMVWSADELAKLDGVAQAVRSNLRLLVTPAVLAEISGAIANVP